MHNSCPLKVFHATLLGTYTCTLACIRKENPKHGRTSSPSASPCSLVRITCRAPDCPTALIMLFLEAWSLWVYTSSWIQALQKRAVQLCEDDIWKPKETPLSSHSGFMRQPAKEGSPRRKARARLEDSVKYMLMWGLQQIRGHAP